MLPIERFQREAFVATSLEPPRLKPKAVPKPIVTLKSTLEDNWQPEYTRLLLITIYHTIIQWIQHQL